MTETIKDMDLDVLNYKKKSDDSESQLKNLKQMFEAVRTERNLNGKNLLQAKVIDVFYLFSDMTALL